MTPADKRVMDLLDRWLSSIELHMKYVDLDDVSYHQMQPWPKHERPARWILELAQQKVLSLQTLCKAHRNDDDPSFAESLELMGFLSNLVGAQHIQRFIPLATLENQAKLDTGMHRAMQTGSMAARVPQTPPQNAAAASAPRPAQSPTVTEPVITNTPPPAATAVIPRGAQPASPPAPPVPAKPAAAVQAQPVSPIPQVKPATVIPLPTNPHQPARPEEGERTREMPRLRPTRGRQLQAARPVEQRRVNTKPAPSSPQPVPHGQSDDVVIADAVRLLKWGRQWHEIAELIARMAERPTINEIRKILRSNKPAIEQQLEV